MICAKKYETVSTSVKVMQKKNRGLFFSGHGVVPPANSIEQHECAASTTACYQCIQTEIAKRKLIVVSYFSLNGR